MSRVSILSEDFSDHFPVWCRLTFQSSTGYDENMNQSTLNKSCSYKWKGSCSNTFIESFSHLFPKFSSNLTSANCIDTLEEFNALYKQAGMSMKRRSGSIQVNTTQPDWWEDECSRTKRVKYKYLRKFRASNRQSDFDLYISQRRLNLYFGPAALHYILNNILSYLIWISPLVLLGVKIY